MKRYHGVSPLEQKRSMPAWLAKPSFVIGLLIVLVVILMALFPQFIAPYDPIATDVTVSNQAPSAAHWFGTDFYGRDIFSRVIWGTRIDLLIGVLGVVIPFLVGGMIGLLAGYYGGFLDSLLMRITDIMMAFPFTILVITIMAILGQGLINLFIALWLVGWMSYAKLVRSEVLVLKDSEFIQAARVAVMFAGQIVEMTDTVTLFSRPRHPYTYGLMGSLPNEETAGTTLEAIKGSPPNLAHLPEGCPFSPRCKYACDLCRRERPALTEVEPGHLARCHRLDVTASFQGLIEVPDGAGRKEDTPHG